MKRLQIILMVSVLALAASCKGNAGGSGGPSGGLISDPSAGLDGLNHYRAVLTRAIKAETAEGPVERTDRLSLAVWREEKAVFETVDLGRETGESIRFTAGTVDQAGYVLWTADTGCRVYWDEKNIQVDEDDLAAYLYPIKTGSAGGEDAVGGVSAHVYDLNSDSLGIQGITAAGKVWLAVDGGYLLKYHLELTGGDALYGEGATGTLTLDYELSDVNNDESVVYPGDCRPVLTDIPATDDAQNLQRMPSRLWYLSPSTQEKIQAFYEDYFSGQGWVQTVDFSAGEGGKDILFMQESSEREALLSIRPEGNATAVNVMTTDNRSSQTAPSTDDTPAGGSGEEPSARIMTSLSRLLGSAETPGALPSFAMVVDQELPAASGKTVTHLEAEVEGLNNHYVRTSGGKTTEALLFGGKEYEIVGGKAEAGSIGLRTDWILWQTDWLKVLMAAGLADPKAEPGTTLEGRAVEVYSVDGTDLPDMTGGILPVQITAMRGTIWVDQATGALLKADLTFDADVKKSGQTEPTHDTGKFLLVVSRIGQVKVTMP